MVSRLDITVLKASVGPRTPHPSVFLLGHTSRAAAQGMDTAVASRSLPALGRTAGASPAAQRQIPLQLPSQPPQPPPTPPYAVPSPVVWYHPSHPSRHHGTRIIEPRGELLHPATPVAHVTSVTSVARRSSSLTLKTA